MFPKMASANLRDGNMSVPPSFSLSPNSLTRALLQTEDFLWAIIFSTGERVEVTLSCGDYSEVTELSGAGAFKLRMPLTGSGGQVSAMLRRDGAGVVSLVPSGFVFSRYPASYNFNAFVASSR
jgi:hypothetical protein